MKQSETLRSTKREALIALLVFGPQIAYQLLPLSVRDMLKSWVMKPTSVIEVIIVVIFALTPMLHGLYTFRKRPELLWTRTAYLYAFMNGFFLLYGMVSLTRYFAE